MRQAPKTVVRALKRYDPLLGVRFDTARRRWTVTRKGEDTTVTDPHRDLSADRLMETVRKSDSHRYPSQAEFIRQQISEPCDRAPRERARDFKRYTRDMKTEIGQRVRTITGQRASVSFAGIESPLLKPKKLNIINGRLIQ